jgi:hypothetical protein
MDEHRDSWGRRDALRSFLIECHCSARQQRSIRKARDRPTATNEDLVKRPTTGPQRKHSGTGTESKTRFGRLRVAHNHTNGHATYSRCCNHVQASVYHRTTTCSAFTSAQ